MDPQKKIFSSNLARILSLHEKSQLEVARAIGVSPQTFNTWIRGVAIPRMGKIQKLADYFGINKSDLVEDHSTLPSNAFPLGNYRIPIVATVAAGEPIYSEENIEGWIDFDRDPHGHVFACRIKGDSMTPRIHDGDIIVVDQESGWEDGDIVLVTVNGNDGTCKRIKKYADSIALISDNSAYAPMIYTAQEVQDLPIEVKGKVIEARARF